LIASRLLSIYLADHEAASAGGAALAARLAGGAIDPGLRESASAVAASIAAERRTLGELMGRLGTRPSVPKRVAVRLGAELGRLKWNGRLAQRSPLSDIVELEALIAGVTGKERLWATLARVLSEAGESADAATARHLQGEAQDQRGLLVAHHDAICASSLRT
jgi:hypothetical protein